ncbi:MAG: ZIP family metal transporter [Planctomycetota bacterium]|nr:ZIP family metal transporter [Planctomycetota bacterium]
MSPLTIIILFCVLIVAGSLLGGWLPSLMKLTHRRMQIMVSFVGGLMLGVALFHLLPHGAAAVGSLDKAMVAVVIGLLVMFFLIRAFHFHSHEVPGDEEHAHDHDHTHTGHRLGWVGVAIGLGLHTAIDGIALGASVVAEHEGHGHGLLPGLGTFLAVLLHKPLDALAITSLMAAGGWAAHTRTLVNMGFALMCPIGALLFYLGAGTGADATVGYALCFSAGVFLCISLGDLLPEVQFHSHDRIKLSVALLLGIALAYAIIYVEGAAHAGHAH